MDEYTCLRCAAMISHASCKLGQKERLLRQMVKLSNAQR